MTPDRPEAPAQPAPFPSAPGRIADLVRRFDWASTPLGPATGWPAALRVAVDNMLGSQFPQCLAWGPQYLMFYNDAYAPILGDKPQALGRPLAEVWAEVWDAIRPILERAYAGEATFIADYPLQIDRGDGLEPTWFTFCYSPLRDEHGRVCGMIDTVVETTDKVLAERRLTQQAASLEREVAARTADRNRLWQLSSDVMLVATFDGIVLAVNPAWSQVLGWPADAVVGRSALELLHPDDLDTARARLEQLAQGQVPPRADLRYRHRDGHYRWISWAATPGDGLVNAVGRDVTAEREQAEALRKAEDLLRHSQKMEAVGQLTGGIAHDFNNLLQAIGGSLQLIERMVEQQRYEALPRHAAAARGAARRAATLTHRLLAFSRRQTLDPRPTDINGLVAGMLELVRRTVGPAIDVHCAPADGLWLTRTDADQLESSLLNLCINARDAMPAGGRLQIVLANRSFPAEDAEALELQPGEYVSLAVTDTGCGMTPAVQARAFDPFYTTKPVGSGTGLGLSMVYGFARQSGGQVRIDSTPGRGTTIEVLLPRTEDAVEPDAASARADEAAAPLADARVLLVEDLADVRQIVGDALRELGLAVVEAADGPSALERLRAPESFALLVSDVGLPGGMNGRQLADAARLLRPGLKVLFVTGYDDTALVASPLVDDHMQVLTKPFDFEVLHQRVTDLLRG